MYHDQGLAPFKLLHFADGVNFTLGLPFVRTSPDHGTAFDIAGTGQADPRSMIAALRLAAVLAGRRGATRVNRRWRPLGATSDSCEGPSCRGRAVQLGHARGLSMKALILTGGAGRTLVPFSSTRPKAMTVVAGGSLMRRTLTHLREVGVTDVTVVLGQNGDKVKAAFEDGQELGVHLALRRAGTPRRYRRRHPTGARALHPGRVLHPGLRRRGHLRQSVPSGPAVVQLLQGSRSPACVCPARPRQRYGNVYLSGTRITQDRREADDRRPGQLRAGRHLRAAHGGVRAAGEERRRHGAGVRRAGAARPASTPRSGKKAGSTSSTRGTSSRPTAW